MPPAREPAVLGEQLHALGYELLGPLGQGGMGEVWRARDRKLDREVAIKFLAPTGGSKSTARFQVEARALARINHPNVVTVYQLGEVDGQPILVYELVDGKSLDKLIGKTTWQQTLAIVCDLARGLAAAHQAGVLHRDLKAANAMLTADGVAKLIDFGLAKLDGVLTPISTSSWPNDVAASALPASMQPAVDADDTAELSIDQLAPESHAHTEADGLTHTDTMLGTPRYVAPEIWLGKPANAATDVYALALIAWELLSSHHAHVGADGAALGRMIVEQPLAKLSQLRPDIPVALANIIDRGVAKRPLDRYRTAAELSDALEQLRAKPMPQPVEHGSPMAAPITRWIQAGDLNLAIQRFGDGPLELVYVPSWVSHCEAAWRSPAYTSFMARLGRLARVTVFDKRGTGLSDRLADPLPVEERVLDISAILDALEIESAVLFGVQDGGAIASVFTAMYPERVRGLIWYASARRLLWSEDYPYGMPASMFEDICAAVLAHWGTPLFADFAAPSLARDPEFLAWWSEYMRNGASPGAAKWMLELNATLDIAPVLPAISVPTLIAHRRGDRMMPLAGGKIVADAIQDARWCELHGDDHLPWVGNQDSLLVAIAEFLGELGPPPKKQRRLLSLLACGDERQRCEGPVDALYRALRGSFAGPVLVDTGVGDGQFERRMTERVERLAGQRPGRVFAGENAVVLAGGSGLSFELLDQFAPDRVYAVSNPH
jgi:serine/threonine protein kinase/pimeloyl-ACP methyl ester carboxylesterase